MFTVVPHIRPNGTCPYAEFYDEVRRGGEKGTAAKIKALESQLRDRGYGLASTNKVGHIEEELWELRSGPNRIFFYWDEREQAFVLLNGFRKKTRRTPRSEIDRAWTLVEEHKTHG